MQNQEASNERGQHSKHFWQGRHLFMSIIDMTNGLLKITVLFGFCVIFFSPSPELKGKRRSGNKKRKKTTGKSSPGLSCTPWDKAAKGCPAILMNKNKKTADKKVLEELNVIQNFPFVSLNQHGCCFGYCTRYEMRTYREKPANTCTFFV